jgi:hypothetical protein
MRIGATFGVILGVPVGLAVFAYLAPSPVSLSLAWLPVGWVGYLIRVLPNVSIDKAGLLTFALCVALFSVGLHFFLRWLLREVRITDAAAGHARWLPRWSGMIIAVLVLMFTAGIATVGVAHQSGWLLRSREPWVEEHSYLPGRGPSEFNLKEIALGARNLNQVGGGQFSRTARSVGLHSWQTHILPFTVTRNEDIDYELPWNHPRNAPCFRGLVHFYLNPDIGVLRTPDGFGVSHYAGNERVLSYVNPFERATDGLANTILAGEVASEFHAWGDP